MMQPENLFLDQAPSPAATNLRPVQTVRAMPVHGWPERSAQGVIWVVLFATLMAGGGVEPRAIAAVSCAIFATCVMLCVFCARDIALKHLDTRRAMMMALAVIAFSGLQAVSGWADLPLVQSAAPRESVLVSVRLGGYLCLFFVIRWSLQNRSQPRHLLMGLFGAIVTIAAIELLRYDVSLSPLSHPGMSGPFANRSAFGMLLSIGLAIALAFATQPAHPRAHKPAFVLFRATFILGAALLFVAILHTQSRLGFVSALVGAGCILGLRSSEIRLFWIVGAIALCVIVGTSGETALLSRLTTGGADLTMRLALYAQVWSMIMDAPFAGHGAGSFATLYEFHQRPPVTAALVWDKTHSTLLLHLVELGLIIGSLPLICAGLIARRLWRQFQKNADAPSIAALAGLCLALVHYIGDFSLEFPSNAQALIVIVALALGPLCLPEKDARK